MFKEENDGERRRKLSGAWVLRKYPKPSEEKQKLIIITNPKEVKQEIDNIVDDFINKYDLKINTAGAISVSFTTKESLPLFQGLFPEEDSIKRTMLIGKLRPFTLVQDFIEKNYPNIVGPSTFLYMIIMQEIYTKAPIEDDHKDER